MSNVIIKAQKLCALRKPTSKTWEEFEALYKLAKNATERAMLDDLSSGLERTLIELDAQYGES